MVTIYSLICNLPVFMHIHLKLFCTWVQTASAKHGQIIKFFVLKIKTNASFVMSKLKDIENSFEETALAPKLPMPVLSNPFKETALAPKLSMPVLSNPRPAQVCKIFAICLKNEAKHKITGLLAWPQCFKLIYVA